VVVRSCENGHRIASSQCDSYRKRLQVCQQAKFGRKRPQPILDELQAGQSQSSRRRRQCHTLTLSIDSLVSFEMSLGSEQRQLLKRKSRSQSVKKNKSDGTSVKAMSVS
jgi:hypothetical protein